MAPRRTVPNGNVYFQTNQGQPVSLYTSWRVRVQLLRDHLAKVEPAVNHQVSKADSVFLLSLEKGHLMGKSKPPEKDTASNVEAYVAEMIRYLDTCEIYLCPHVTFSDSFFNEDFTGLVTSGFAPSDPKYSLCPDCKASYTVYVDSTGEVFWIIIARPICMEESAMDPAWINATREPTERDSAKDIRSEFLY